MRVCKRRAFVTAVYHAVVIAGISSEATGIGWGEEAGNSQRLPSADRLFRPRLKAEHGEQEDSQGCDEHSPRLVVDENRNHGEAEKQEDVGPKVLSTGHEASGDRYQGEPEKQPREGSLHGPVVPPLNGVHLSVTAERSFQTEGEIPRHL